MAIEDILNVKSGQLNEWDELHLKDNKRGDRIKRSAKARAERHRIKDSLDREYERGFKGKY